MPHLAAAQASSSAPRPEPFPQPAASQAAVPVQGATPATTGDAAAQSVAAPTALSEPFDVWLQGVRIEAIERGIRPETVKRALDGITPVPQILERDRAQAEFSITIAQYFERRLTPELLASARTFFAEHQPLLAKVQEKYRVQSRYLLAVWALESNFGRFAGVRPMMPTLATLAYDPRRATLFRQQLFDALTVLDKGYIELDALKGSWAGAMGQPQFMPSSYLEYAQDFDGDGRRDIWSSEADVFASIAYYLQRHGWESDETWGRRVTVPASAEPRLVEEAPLRPTGCRAERQLSIVRPLSLWKTLGLERTDGEPIPATDQAASLLRTDDGKAYLVFRNYEALLSYNCAHAYALSVGHLGDAIVGLGALPVEPKAKSAAPAKRATATRPKAGAAGARKTTKSSTASKSKAKASSTKSSTAAKSKAKGSSSAKAKAAPKAKPKPATTAKKPVQKTA